MEKSLSKNDLLMVDKVCYGFQSPNLLYIPFLDKKLRIPSFRFAGYSEVKRGQVIVFRSNSAAGAGNFIKRCVAVGGDVVEIRNKKLFINGWQEKYILGEELVRDQIVHNDSIVYASSFTDENIFQLSGNRDNIEPIRVPDGKFFVLGDNRDNSFDSRYLGFIDRKDILGKALLVYFSFETFSDDAFNSVRWQKILKFVH